MGGGGQFWASTVSCYGCPFSMVTGAPGRFNGVMSRQSYSMRRAGGARGGLRTRNGFRK